MNIGIITGLKIPGIHALLTNKTREDYNCLLGYITNLIDLNSSDIIIITIDFEEALINSVEHFFQIKGF